VIWPWRTMVAQLLPSAGARARAASLTGHIVHRSASRARQSRPRPVMITAGSR
jgi:hypothetical protein